MTVTAEMKFEKSIVHTSKNILKMRLNSHFGVLKETVPWGERILQRL